MTRRRVAGAIVLCLSVAAGGAAGADRVYDRGFGFWHVSCYDDRMDDHRSCFVSQKSLSIQVSNRGSRYVHVGSDHYPGSEVALRVDRGTPLRWIAGERPSTAATGLMIDRLKSGAQALYRYYEWPNKLEVDADVDLSRFTAAYDDAARAAAAYPAKP